MTQPRKSLRPAAPENAAPVIDANKVEAFINGAMEVAKDKPTEEQEPPVATEGAPEPATELAAPEATAPEKKEYPWDAEEDTKRNTGKTLLMKFTEREKAMLDFLAQNSPNSRQEWLTFAMRKVLVEYAERCYDGEQIAAR